MYLQWMAPGINSKKIANSIHCVYVARFLFYLEFIILILIGDTIFQNFY